MVRDDFGKNIRYIVILVAVALLTIVPVTHAAYAASASDPAVIVLSPSATENEVTVDAVLRQNTGLSELVVELVYDTTAMELVNVERGDALSKLEFLTTNSDTEQGFAFTPFKLNWSGDENDYSTGNIVRLHFATKPEAKDGDYTIELKADRVTDASYIVNGTAESKSVLIDIATIRITDNKPSPVLPTEEKPEEENKPNVALIVSLSVVGAVIVAGAITFVIIWKKKGKKSWKKVE